MESTDAFLQVAACEDNISRWKAKIRELETKIVEEEQKKKRLADKAVEVPRDKIDTIANEGIQLYSDALVISSE
ncbi:hypothetical protein A2U01_0051150, partial [Trifolium medium]|nr:hypothetical protein [Trifolium medium]